MRADKIEIGKIYRLKDSPNYTYVKPVEIFKPDTWQMKELARKNDIKPFRYIVVKCEHTIDKDDTTGFIRYFLPDNIIECEQEPTRE
jgi:hypothetical protein